MLLGPQRSRPQRVITASRDIRIVSPSPWGLFNHEICATESYFSISLKRCAGMPRAMSLSTVTVVPSLQSTLDAIVARASTYDTRLSRAGFSSVAVSLFPYKPFCNFKRFAPPWDEGRQKNAALVL